MSTSTRFGGSYKLTKRFQGGWNVFEVTWVMLIVGSIATGISFGHRYFGGYGGTLIGAIAGGMAGIICARLAQLAISATLARRAENRRAKKSD